MDPRPVAEAELHHVVERLRRLAEELDRRWRLPGTPIRFGWDAVLGLVPGIGDAIPLLLGATIPLVAVRCGVPLPVVARMVANLGVDAFLGAVPVIGDLFDIAWKAHRRNLRLLEAALANPRRAARRSAAWWALGLAAVLVVIVGLAALIVAAVVAVARRAPLW